MRELLERKLAEATANRDVWLKTLADEEALLRSLPEGHPTTAAKLENEAAITRRLLVSAEADVLAFTAALAVQS